MEPTARRFPRIWYRSGPKVRRFKPLRAWEDVGTLSVEHNRLAFYGKRGEIILDAPRVIGVGLSGVDFINVWVTVEGAGGVRAQFADGTKFGWGGIRGRTEALANVISETSA